MADSLVNLEKVLHSRYLNALNMSRFIQNGTFQHAYTAATTEERAIAHMHIEAIDQIKLTLWVKDCLKKYNLFECLDVRYLREIAQSAGIKNPTLLGRLALINLLQQQKQKPEVLNYENREVVA